MVNMISKHLRCLTQFSGRESRGEFWPWVGVTIALYLLLFMGSVALLFAQISSGNEESPVPVLSLMFTMNEIAIAAILALLAAAVVRRLHDSNRTGAWGLLPLPSLVIALVLMPEISAGTPNNPEPDMDLFFVLFFNNMIYLVLLIVLIVMCAKPSTIGDNRFGPPSTN
jgi:uncharacterized membrane protein YhaH (DUF805 family)